MRIGNLFFIKISFIFYLQNSSSPQDAVEVKKDTHLPSEFAVCEFGVGALPAFKRHINAVGIFGGWYIAAFLEHRITGWR